MDARENSKRSALVAAEVVEVFIGAAVVLMSFIWFPVLGAAMAFALFMGAGLWMARAVWGWYDRCYPNEMDAKGKMHPYMRVMTGIGRPSSGFMGGREADQLRPNPSFRFVAGRKSPLTSTLLNEEQNEPQVWEDPDQYRYGA